MSLSDSVLLSHILDEANFIVETVRGKSQDEVLNDPIIFRAVVRSIEIIGEATKKLSDDFKAQHPEIEWKKMARTKDVLIHAYFAIDNEIIWGIIQEKIPPLQRYIMTII